MQVIQVGDVGNAGTDTDSVGLDVIGTRKIIPRSDLSRGVVIRRAVRNEVTGLLLGRIRRAECRSHRLQRGNIVGARSDFVAGDGVDGVNQRGLVGIGVAAVLHLGRAGEQAQLHRYIRRLAEVLLNQGD